MFAGSHLLTIDDKGRLAIPARFRQQFIEKFGAQVVITRSYLPCVEIYPVATFNDVIQQIDQIPDRKRADLAMRSFLGHAEHTEIDKQGRVLLPQLLRKLARLDSDAVAVGQMRHIEIWSEKAWIEASVPEGEALSDSFVSVKR
jgi:MraZ protein